MEEAEYVGSGRRFLIAMLDAAFIGVLFPVYERVAVVTCEYRTVLPEVAWNVALVGATTVLTVRFGGTPAKLLLGARVGGARRIVAACSLNADFVRPVP